MSEAAAEEAPDAGAALEAELDAAAADLAAAPAAAPPADGGAATEPAPPLDAAAEEEPDGGAAAEPPADEPAVDAEPPADEPAAEAAPEADADEDLPSFVGGDAPAEEEDSLAPSAELYDCEKGCGYRGTFDDVELHEQTCKYPDVTPPATVEEESQEETLNTAQLDLSDLFNASALTNLFQGLQHQLKHQQKRLGQLESATHELEAARLAHAAEKEIWEVQQAELRHELERDKRMFDRKVRQAVRDSLGGLHVLQNELNREKGMKRLCAYMTDKEMQVQGMYFNSWKHAANEITLFIKKKKILLRLGNMGANHGLIMGWTNWLEKHKAQKHKEGMARGFERLVEICVEKQQKKRSFHHWTEIILCEQLREAVGHTGADEDFSMEPDENQAEIFRIAEKAARPYMMRAAQAAEALKLRDAFENCSFGFMASLKVLEAEDDIVRRKEEREMALKDEALRASLASVAQAAEDRRVEGMTELEERLKEFIGASVTSAVTVLDAKFGSLITKTCDDLEHKVNALHETLTERVDALETQIKSTQRDAEVKALANQQETEATLSSYSDEVTSLRTDLRGVSVDVVGLDRSLRDVYEDVRKHVLWEQLQRKEAQDASQAWLRAALGHHKHEKIICSSSTKSDRTAAFKKERDHIASSIARLLNGLTTASQLTGEGVAPPRLEVIESGFVDDVIEEATPLVRPRTPQKLEPLVLTSGFETGRIKGSLWDEVEITKQMYRGRIDDVHESLMSTQAKLPKALGAAPPRPHPQRLVERVFAPYEDLVKEKGRLVTVPSELAYAAAYAAKALSDHVAAAANLEEIARVARGTAAYQLPSATVEYSERTGRGFTTEAVSGLTGGPDGIANRRIELVREFVRELQDACVRLRPQAGALRLEARVRFVRRFHEACDSALSVYDQVIAEAPTLMGRSSKLPACVACNRPLPTKIQREPRRDDPAPPPPRETRPPLTEVQQLLASRGPELPRPLSASITRRDAEIDATTPKIERRGFRQTRPQSRSGRVAPR